jgi:ribulose-5-phosphate 4-epimerase/fuculose-1-phosphate aldolase
MAEPIEQVVAASLALGAAGHSDMVWGHVSVRDPDGRGAWMKAAGWGLAEVAADRVLLVSAAGDVLAGQGRRHIEYPIHTEVMGARADVHAVVHTHAPAATSFASLDVPVRAISHDGVMFAEPDIPRFTVTGSLIRTSELGQALAATIGSHVGCLIPQHGLVTVGADVGAAVMRAVLLERACRVQLQAMAAGGPARWSDPAELRRKHAEVWGPGQLADGYAYLLRQAGQAPATDATSTP